ncbi:hypothetical protein ACIGXM_32040 [Kitasatospora sp. NPDC052896]|uniref:hypothetical protein n=1 Tax=Kitasatospora sp. NPDC052896 TaxID=3364061 RepID=UPI0037CC7BE2
MGPHRAPGIGRARPVSSLRLRWAAGVLALLTVAAAASDVGGLDQRGAVQQIRRAVNAVGLSQASDAVGLKRWFKEARERRGHRAGHAHHTGRRAPARTGGGPPPERLPE